MSLTWQVMKEGVNEAWKTITSACDHATFFHTQAWADLFCTTFKHWRPDPIVLEFSDGNLMVLPMVRRQYFGYRESMVPHVYGGPVFLRPPNSLHLEAAQQVPTWFTDVTLIDNPFSPYVREQDGLARWRLHTMATDLTPGYGTLWRSFRDTHRRHFKTAHKQGVTVTLAASVQDVDAYYEVYQDSLHRWGKGAIGFYPRRLFRNMFQMPEYGKTVKVWLAKFGGKIIGGIVMLYHGEQAVYWHGVSHSSYLSQHPSPLLLITAIEAACAEYFRWFDFMGPNRHLKKVQHFKEGFASQPLRYDAYYCHNSIKGIGFDRYRRFKERVLRQCPL